MYISNIKCKGEKRPVHNTDFCKFNKYSLRDFLKEKIVLEFLMGGGILFQHFVAAYLKLPRNAVVLCLGQIKRIAQRILRAEKSSFSYKYDGLWLLMIPKSRVAK